MELGISKWGNTSYVGGRPPADNAISRAFSRAFAVGNWVDDLVPAAYKPKDVIGARLCDCCFAVRHAIPFVLLQRLRTVRRTAARQLIAASRQSDLEDLLNHNVVWYPPMP